MENNINERIYIFSRPIRSGKTTQLQTWLKLQENCAGVLTPDIGGKRMIFNIAGNKFHPFEVDAAYGGDVVDVGNFLFAKTAFALGQDILERTLFEHYPWTIIDEVGKLEIEQGEGFEPAVLRLVKAFQTGKEGKLLLVIRDSLLEKAMVKYELLGCRIISTELPV
jgi:nucleoside-triphosphatase THEP1